LKKAFFFTAIIGLIYACQPGEKNEKSSSEAQKYAESYNIDQEIYSQVTRTFIPLPKTSENPENISSPEKVKLGKILFFDTRLSKDGNISCNSCHDLSTFGVDNLPTSPGDQGENGARNSPTVLNSSFHTTQFWDGRAKDVEEQAGMPILNPVEMAIPDEKFLVDRLIGIELYQGLFSAAFPEDSDPLLFINIQKAIGAFERTLLTPSKFDDYVAGKKGSLTLRQKRGLQTFINVGCITCHTGIMLGGNMFQKFGVHEDYWEYTGSENIDMGRFEITGNEADKYVFRVPTLRNVTKTGPYFHDGSIGDLRAAIKIMARVNLNKGLTEDEVKSIISFFESLEGEVEKDWGEIPDELSGSL
jgi:cytochrome c peroxidase